MNKQKPCGAHCSTFALCLCPICHHTLIVLLFVIEKCVMHIGTVEVTTCVWLPLQSVIYLPVCCCIFLGHLNQQHVFHEMKGEQDEFRRLRQMMVDMCVTVPLFFLFGCLLGFSVVVQLFYIYVNFQVTSFRLRGQYFPSPIEITPTGDFRLTVQQKIPLPRWVFYLFWRVLDQLPVPKMDTYHRLC